MPSANLLLPVQLDLDPLHNNMAYNGHVYDDILGDGLISHDTGVRLDLVEDGAVSGTGPEELPPVPALSLPSTTLLPTQPPPVPTKLTSCKQCHVTEHDSSGASTGNGDIGGNCVRQPRDMCGEDHVTEGRVEIEEEDDRGEETAKKIHWTVSE